MGWGSHPFFPPLDPWHVAECVGGDPAERERIRLPRADCAASASMSAALASARDPANRPRANATSHEFVSPIDVSLRLPSDFVHSSFNCRIAQASVS